MTPHRVNPRTVSVAGTSNLAERANVKRIERSEGMMRQVVMGLLGSPGVA
jgi:outer membrane protein assembly factor BamE (lipoprotein component of BamABCDE complex)